VVTILKEIRVRNLTKTLAVVSLLIPASAYSLGIGEIKLHSALNQNLDAEIALMLSPGEKASDIKVNLAAPDKFDETGVAWNYFLSKLRFQTIEVSGGRAIIKISTKEALKEPFLDFLLQVTWPKGDLYREFTVLIDPPTEYAQTTVPVSSPVESYAPEPYYPSQRQALQRPHAGPSARISGDRYGPTVRNDTLSKVAERIGKDADVSIEQLMIALFEANPRAFYKANVNALLAGKTLTLPKKEAILKLSKSEALDEFNRQIQAWKTPSTIGAATTKIAQNGSSDGQLTLVAPTQDSVSGAASVAPANQQIAVDKPTASLPAVNPNNSQQGQGAGNQAAIDDAIKAKMVALEKQLAAMQELIALKDQQLATLQNQAPAKVSGQPQPAVPTPTAPVFEPAKPAQQPIPVPMPATNAAPAGKPAAQAGLQPQQSPSVKPPVAKPVRRHVATPAPASAPDEDTSIWYYLGAGTVGLGLLGFLGWFWQQKRKNSYEGLFAASEMGTQSKSTDMFSEPAKDFASFDSDLTTDDNLFSSEFATGEFDVFDMDQAEIDPISEADVYLAYGRYQQAEDLMRHAIDEQPEHNEFKLKLLEIFYASENREAFEKYTTALIDEGRIDSTEFWAKVSEMGSEICPGSILFSSAAQQQPSAPKKVATVADSNVAATESLDSQLDEMDFDLSSFDELFYNEQSEKPEKPASNLESGLFADNLFDFNGEIDSKPGGQVDKQGEEPLQNNVDIEFDLDFDGLSVPQENKILGPSLTESPPDLKDNSEFEAFDFDFGGIIEDEAAKEPMAFELEAPTLAAAENLDDSYRVLDFSVDITQEPNRFDGSPDSNSIGFDQSVVDVNGQKDVDSFGVADLTKMDEMETKLDLAMAYIDMDDRDAAHEIAVEVLEKGTPEQKMVAKALLENI
jgi:pilus assembly protein FimV